MTEEVKKDEVKKEEDKGVEVKKTLDADLEYSGYDPEVSGTEWYNWGTRLVPDMWGIATSRSKYGKGDLSLDGVPSVKAPDGAPKTTGLWGKTQKGASKVNETIDAGAKKFTDMLDNAVNNNPRMIEVNKDLNKARDYVIDKGKNAVKKVGKGWVSIKDAIPLAKSGTKVASTIDNAVGLAVKGGSKAVSVADDAAEVAVKAATKGGSKFFSKGFNFFAKKMPYASAYFAYDYATDRFNEDETREGIQEIFSGVAGCVPGVGSLVSMYLDFDLLMYDECGYHPMDFHRINPIMPGLKSPFPTENEMNQLWEWIKTGDCAYLRYERLCEDKGIWPTRWGAVEYAKYEESEKTLKKRQEKAHKEAVAKMEKELNETVEKSKSDLVKLKQESKKLADNANLSAEELQYLSLQYREASLMVTLQENALAVVNNKKNAGSVKPNKNDFIKSVAPLYDNSGMVGDLKNYKNAEFNVEYNQCEDTRTLSAKVDGELHGAVICLSANNEVLDVKLYNHGEEVNFEDKAVDIYNCADPAFGRYCAVEVDGEKFGWELTGDVNGCTKVAFYDEGANGYVNVENINLRKHLSMTPAEMTAQSDDGQQGRFDLFYDLKNQSADEQHLTGQYALAQAKCDLSLHNASKRDNYVEELTPEEKAEGNGVAQATPFKVDVSKER